MTEELSQARPEVLHLHSFTTHVHGVRAARAIGLRPTLVSFHDFRLGARRAWTCRRLAPWVDRVVVLNETMCRLYAQAGRYPPEKLFVLPNAVDTGYFSPGARDETLARQWGLGSEEYLIGSVGGLNHNKGHGFLVEAFAQVRSKLPGARLILVGAGRDRVHLEELVARLGLADRVLFAGKQTNIRSWLSLLDLYVQPSRIEADPLSVHEAMACSSRSSARIVAGCLNSWDMGRRACWCRQRTLRPWRRASWLWQGMLRALRPWPGRPGPAGEMLRSGGVWRAPVGAI